VIEIIVKDGARCRYTTIQNWSHNVYNLVTQRSMVGRDATMEWVDGNLGSKLTMKYPSCYLMGEGARGEILSIAYAGRAAPGRGRQGDPHGAAHLEPDRLQVDLQGGRAQLVPRPAAGANPARTTCAATWSATRCCSTSRRAPTPTRTSRSRRRDAQIGHEATVSKIGDEQLFYLMSRGLSEDEAATMVVRGFIEPIAKELPLEYAVELNRLIELEMEGSVG
jgi:Fe-S cluster assembly protein SufB